MATFLGKEIKPFQPTWKVVESSIQRLSPESLTQVKSIIVYDSQYNDNQMWARITLESGYVDFTVDSKCYAHLEVGDSIDPESVMVYQLTNGDQTVTRLYGKPL